MNRADVLRLLAAAAGLAIVVALITPSTKPVPAPAGDWRKEIPVKTGMAAPAPSTTPIPGTAFAHPPAPVQPVAVGDRPTFVVDQPSQPAIAANRDDRLAQDGDAARRFRQGYHWAERNGIDDERDFYRRPGDPFTDGCLAALSDGDRGDDYPPARFRPYR